MEQVTVTIPNNVFGKDSRAIARELLERVTLEAYRSEIISVGRLAEILGFSIDEAHNFLKEAKQNQAQPTEEEDQTNRQRPSQKQ